MRLRPSPRRKSRLLSTSQILLSLWVTTRQALPGCYEKSALVWIRGNRMSKELDDYRLYYTYIKTMDRPLDDSLTSSDAVSRMSDTPGDIMIARWPRFITVRDRIFDSVCRSRPVIPLSPRAEAPLQITKFDRSSGISPIPGLAYSPEETSANLSLVRLFARKSALSHRLTKVLRCR